MIDGQSVAVQVRDLGKVGIAGGIAERVDRLPWRRQRPDAIAVGQRVQNTDGRYIGSVIERVRIGQPVVPVQHRRGRPAADVGKIARCPLVAPTVIVQPLAVVVQDARDAHAAALRPACNRQRRPLVAVAGVHAYNRPLPRERRVPGRRQRRRQGNHLKSSFRAGIIINLKVAVVGRMRDVGDRILPRGSSR